MSTKRKGFKFILLALAAIMLLSFPLAAGAAMENGITRPSDGATVKGVVEVAGYASDPAFSKWQLDVLPGGAADGAIFLAVGDKPGEFTYSLNTNPLPNGEHALRLRVVRSDSNYSEYINKFTIANGAAQPAAAKDIVATAVGAGQFNTLVAAVKAAGLVEALQGKGPFTVFAPTDEAFAKLPAGTVEGLLKDPKALSNILLYHVVPGAVKAAAVKDGLTAKTLQGSPVTFKVMDGKAMIDGANIVATDVMASNGVIHVIDSVILPPAKAAAPAAAAAAPAAKDIVATAVGAGQFNTLVAAVKAAGLVEALQGKGPFTVFAPTDEAFAKLPAGTVEGLLKDPKALCQHPALPRRARCGEGRGREGWPDRQDAARFARDLQGDGRQGDDRRRWHRGDRCDGLERCDPRHRLSDPAARQGRSARRRHEQRHQRSEGRGIGQWDRHHQGVRQRSELLQVAVGPVARWRQQCVRSSWRWATSRVS